MRQAQDTWEPGLLALYTELGLTGPARSLLHRLLENSDDWQAQQPWWGQWIAVLVFLVEAAVALRDADAARRLRPLLALFTGRQLVAGSFVALFGPADAYLASLDSVLGDDESAELLFERALDLNRLLGSAVHRAQILAAWAGHLRSRGDLSRRYEEMLDEARRLAASTGQVRLMRTLDPPHAARRWPDGAGGRRLAPDLTRAQQPRHRRRAEDHRKHGRQPRAQHPDQDRGGQPHAGRDDGGVAALGRRRRPGSR
jgi:hypothetical protein